jgi:predicted  nucleic acid-binding Zn-ribbon protein
MSDIDAMQGRIMAALERIGQGLDGLGPQATAEETAELETLRQQLEDERLANAQLEERVKALNKRAKQAEEAAENAGAGGPDHADTLRKLDGELQSMRRANQQLRDNNAALRKAGEAGVVEPHLINKAMMAELEGLRTARATDRAEMDVILAELGQIMPVDAADNAASADKPAADGAALKGDA